VANQQKPRKVGRPKLPKGEARGRIVPVRFSADELKAMMSFAKANKQSLSEWIRNTLRSTYTTIRVVT
jgi:hypothetical protein